MLLYVLLFVSVASAAAYNDDRNEKYTFIDSVYNEQLCLMAGGTCVKETDCDEPTMEKGLCPNQRSKGVECCFGLSKYEQRCRKRGGECETTWCRIVYENASDCSIGQKCCIKV